jgi:thioredoxin reductase
MDIHLMADRAAHSSCQPAPTLNAPPASGLTLIVGAGPAGAACAMWLHRLGCPVLLLERTEAAGGLQRLSPYLNVWMPCVQARAGQEVAAGLHEQLENLGVPARYGVEVQGVERVRSGWQLRCAGPGSEPIVLRAAHIVLATGARFRSGGFQHGPRIAVGPGLRIESMDVKGKTVAILGGGDSAFEQFRFIRARGAAQCRIFARSVRARLALRSAVPAHDVVVGPFEANAVNMQVNGQAFDLFNVLFGFEPVVPPGLEGLDRTDRGFVAADHWGLTSLPGVLAVGEVAQTLHPCVATSVAHGIQAAKHLHRLWEQLHTAPEHDEQGVSGGLVHPPSARPPPQSSFAPPLR